MSVYTHCHNCGWPIFYEKMLNKPVRILYSGVQWHFSKFWPFVRREKISWWEVAK